MTDNLFADADLRATHAHEFRQASKTDDRATPTHLNHRSAALALLNLGNPLTRKSGSFLGQLAVDATPMSVAQASWLATLLERNELPPLAQGGAR